jgi:hypothetical protein
VPDIESAFWSTWWRLIFIGFNTSTLNAPCIRINDKYPHTPATSHKSPCTAVPSEFSFPVDYIQPAPLDHRQTLRC